MLAIIEPRTPARLEEDVVLRTALEEPLDSASLDSFLKEDCLVVVNDATRSTPTHRILTALQTASKTPQLRFIISTGTHRGPTQEELTWIFQEWLGLYASRIHVHDCRDTSSHVYIGKTSRGTEVYVNRLLAEAKRVLVISSVEPHYFAGYTGGRKSLIPGLAGFRTIEQNHRWALSSDSQPLRLDGNPVHEDLMEAVSLLHEKEIFSIQLVLDRDGRICAAFAGSLDVSFREAVDAASRIYVTEVREKAAVVIAAAKAPLDVNLYQAHKALEHGKLALKKGGTIVLVAACPEGIGPRHYYDMLASIKTRDGFSQFLAESQTAPYTLGLHKAVKIVQLLQESEIWMKSEMQDEDLQRIQLKPIHDLQKSLDEALSQHGADARVAILTDGATCVPKIA